MSGDEFSHNNLSELYHRTAVRSLDSDERLVIFSDLHMGNGSRTDDFLHNGDLFASVLSRYYADEQFHLILNGDVEELQRFHMKGIVRRWRVVYQALEAIAERGGVTRLVGNHDLDLLEGGPGIAGIRTPTTVDGTPTFAAPIHEALRLANDSGELFVFHGHQTSRWYEHHNNLVRMALKYIANPLHIRNYTVAANSRKRFRTERRVYDFAGERKVLAIIGHTHRPLFESMSKIDSLQFEIERQCRKYPRSRHPEKIEKRIAYLKQELLEARAEQERDHDGSSLYRENLLVPTMFNSGCVLGKRGITCLEIDRGRMRLVYWYDRTRKQKYLQYRTKHSLELPGTPYCRVVIKEDALDYIFSRIRLLA